MERQSGNGIGLSIHFWSLAVEEQFYLFWPLVVWLVRPRAIPWVAGAVAVFATVFRFAWAVQGGHEKTVIAWATLLRPDALFVGAICAYLFRYPARVSVFRTWLPWIATLGVGSSFLALSGMFFFPVQAGRLLFGSSPAHHNLDEAIPFYMDCGGVYPAGTGIRRSGALLAAHTEGESSWMQKFLSSRALAPIGKYSYANLCIPLPDSRSSNDLRGSQAHRSQRWRSYHYAIGIGYRSRDCNVRHIGAEL